MLIKFGEKQTAKYTCTIVFQSRLKKFFLGFKDSRVLHPTCHQGITNKITHTINVHKNLAIA